MWLRIEHTTSFTYDGPIAEAYTELRVRPLDGGGQHCTSFRLETTPPGVRVREYRDSFGNDVLHFDVLEPHERLEVRSLSEVMTPILYEENHRRPTPLELHDFSMPTEYAPFSDRIREFIETHASDETGNAARALRLMQGVQAELAYETGATDVRTRADEALELGRGVCQDFAHVLITACRLDGIPARYVSGYLYDSGFDNGAEASHAWVDIWDDAVGWIALDPTHDRAQNDHYVRVATGRDYADVPPTRGVWRGSADETLEVGVKLVQL